WKWRQKKAPVKPSKCSTEGNSTAIRSSSTRPDPEKIREARGEMVEAEDIEVEIAEAEDIEVEIVEAAVDTKVCTHYPEALS
ncbi:MAG: hypothetical protein NT022_01880, partial [Deltaproteobacteria bacterium]|nr:hypothetical protein [Deltaproteobacteria bacterium]